MWPFRILLLEFKLDLALLNLKSDPEVLPSLKDKKWLLIVYLYCMQDKTSLRQMETGNLMLPETHINKLMQKLFFIMVDTMIVAVQNPLMIGSIGGITIITHGPEMGTIALRV